MYVSRDMLLAELPPITDEYIVIADKQVVKDIMKELLEAYPVFAKFYDRIGMFFEGETLWDTCNNLYNFCIQNLRYSEESEDWQTSALPTGILTRGYCDCKGYASFIGGCLGAIERATGEPIPWQFCFASYKEKQKTPYHVFIVVHSSDGPIWIDPTPGANDMEPKHAYCQKPAETIGAIRQVVNASGEIEFETIGAASDSSLNVPPSAIPLPTGYPAGIPSPYVVGGKIQFTPVPPNFDPTPEQVAWIMWALQVWVLQYGTQKYNVFNWRYHTDGTGSGIASFVAQFCGQYNPQTLKMLQNRRTTLLFDHYKTQAQVDQLNTQIFALQNIMGFDFGNPPDPFTPSEIDKIMDGIAIAVLKAASNLLPVIGPAYANAWLKEFTSNEGAVFDAQSIQEAQNIQTAQQAQVDAGTTDYTTYIIIGAAALLLLWWVSDSD